MKNWTVQKLVIVGFVVVIAITTGICSYILFGLSSIERDASVLREEHVEGIHLIGTVEGNAQRASRHLFHLLLVDDPARRREMLDQESAVLAANTSVIDRLQKVFRRREEIEYVETILEPRKPYVATRQRIIGLVAAEQNAEARALYREALEPQLDAYMNAIARIKDYNRNRSETALQSIRDSVKRVSRVVLVLTLASLLLGITVARTVVRQLGATLKKLMMALIQVNSSATEMTDTLKEQQISTNDVASTSVEVGVTAKEISATTQELGRTMADVAAVSEQTATLANGSQAGLNRLEGTMRQMMEATASISGKLAILNEKTSNINSVVTTINKVADQTNLLSLNAAIEAEKAGEFGHGFSVVATEIRRLADQTAVATYDIEQMVKEMQGAVSAGVMGMDKFSEEVRRGNDEVCAITAQLVQIIQQVQALTPRFESVNEGMQAQSTAAGQISDALAQLGEAAQQSALTVQQNTRTIEQLKEAAQGLKEAVSRFRTEG